MVLGKNVQRPTRAKVLRHSVPGTLESRQEDNVVKRYW